jgi:predicted LPLAT superfamily acyltransferase
MGDRLPPAEAAAGAPAAPVLRPFLGVPAPFSDGPLRLAQLLRQRVIFMVGLYRGGRRYEVRFEPLADFRQRSVDPAARERALQEAISAYVARLEAVAREAPYNWFNFHDFWGEDAGAS